METNPQNQEKITTLSGLDSVRAKAKQQSSVRFLRSESNDERITWTEIRNLKSFVHEEPEQPEIPEEPFILRIWHQFQEALGNR